MPIYRRLIPVITAHPSRWAGSATPRRLPLACLCPFPICSGIGGRVPFSVPCVPVLPGRWRKARCPLPVRPMRPVRCRARTPARRSGVGAWVPLIPRHPPRSLWSGAGAASRCRGAVLLSPGAAPALPGREPLAAGRAVSVAGHGCSVFLCGGCRSVLFGPCPSWYQVGGRGPFCPCPSFLLPGREKAHCPQGFPLPFTPALSPLGRQHAARCASRLSASIGRQAPRGGSRAVFPFSLCGWVRVAGGRLLLCRGVSGGR